jgi:hypothetical protein
LPWEVGVNQRGNYGASQSAAFKIRLYFGVVDGWAFDYWLGYGHVFLHGRGAK